MYKSIYDKEVRITLLHLMFAIACAHSSTPAASLMCVKSNTRHFGLWYFCLEYWSEKNERKIKNIKLNS